MKKTEKNKNLFVLAVIMLVNALSYGTIIPLMYPYASKFGLSAIGLSFLVASFSLAQFIATPIMGRLSDRYGRKPLLLVSLLGTSLALALFGSAQTTVLLFVARILDGITGGNVSVAQAAIADVTNEQERAKAFGMLGAAFGVGFVLGPALGGLMSEISLSAPFFFASILALLGVLLGLLFFKETNTHLESKSIGSKLIDFGAMASTLRSPNVGAVFLVSLISLTGMNALIIGFQSYTVDVLLLNAKQIGVLFAVFGVISVIVQGFGIKFLLERASSKRQLIQACLVLSAIVMLVVGIVGGDYWVFALLMWMFGVVNSPINAVVTALLSARTNIEDQGGMLGLNQSYTSLAQIFGPLAAGAVLGYSVGAVFLMASLLFVVAAVVARSIPGVAAEKVDL